MQILFETTWLAPGQIQSADKFRLNGSQIVDEADFFRAATKTFFPRGNQSVRFSFVTHWSFASTVAAEVFLLTLSGQLPMTNQDNGVLQCICGPENPATSQTCYMTGAILEGFEILDYVGTSVDVEYTIVGPGFTTSVPPNIPSYPNPNELVQVFRRGQIAITNGATTVAVTYSSPLPGMPGADPYCWVSGPSGSPMFDAWCEHDTVSVNGFTAVLGSAAPNGNYFLNYAVFM